jgi:hypothetical protein
MRPQVQRRDWQRPSELVWASRTCDEPAAWPSRRSVAPSFVPARLLPRRRGRRWPRRFARRVPLEQPYYLELHLLWGLSRFDLVIASMTVSRHLGPVLGRTGSSLSAAMRSGPSAARQCPESLAHAVAA